MAAGTTPLKAAHRALLSLNNNNNNCGETECAPRIGQTTSSSNFLKPCVWFVCVIEFAFVKSAD